MQLFFLLNCISAYCKRSVNSRRKFYTSSLLHKTIVKECSDIGTLSADLAGTLADLHKSFGSESRLLVSRLHGIRAGFGAVARSRAPGHPPAGASHQEILLGCCGLRRVAACRAYNQAKEVASFPTNEIATWAPDVQLRKFVPAIH